MKVEMLEPKTEASTWHCIISIWEVIIYSVWRLSLAHLTSIITSEFKKLDYQGELSSPHIVLTRLFFPKLKNWIKKYDAPSPVIILYLIMKTKRKYMWIKVNFFNKKRWWQFLTLLDTSSYSSSIQNKWSWMVDPMTMGGSQQQWYSNGS